jgi:hypothetical protein
MSRLVDIPRLEQRLRTHLTTMTWEESANNLESNLNVVGEAGLLSPCHSASLSLLVDLS